MSNISRALPVVAIVGRPNVGKSTLFNQFTRTRDALVLDQPGVTRDRQYGQGRIGDRPFIVIDTGGIGGEEVGLDGKMAQQARLAVGEADIVILMLDARDGLTALDEALAMELRRLAKKTLIVVNKCDGQDPANVLADFSRLGAAQVFLIAAVHGRGIDTVVDAAFADLPEPDALETLIAPDVQGIKVAIVGRPNVGKSTLVNRILGEERVVAFDEPGTTRTSIAIPFKHDDQDYILIDTAGVRRRSRVNATLEKFSVIKTLQTISASNVAVVVIDAQDGLTDQDLRLLDFVIEAGRALVVAVNKWDGLSNYQRERINTELDRRLGFVNFAETLMISALHGTGVGLLYKAIDRAYASAMVPMATPELTRLLEQAGEAFQPPLVHGRRVKLRYAHPGGHNPPTIVIHGNQTDKLPDSYKRYLNHFFRDALRVVGSPIALVFKTGENPYKPDANKPKAAPAKVGAKAKAAEKTKIKREAKKQKVQTQRKKTTGKSSRVVDTAAETSPRKTRAATGRTALPSRRKTDSATERTSSSSPRKSRQVTKHASPSTAKTSRARATESTSTSKPRQASVLKKTAKAASAKTAVSTRAPRPTKKPTVTEQVFGAKTAAMRPKTKPKRR